MKLRICQARGGQPMFRWLFTSAQCLVKVSCSPHKPILGGGSLLCAFPVVPSRFWYLFRYISETAQPSPPPEEQAATGTQMGLWLYTVMLRWAKVWNSTLEGGRHRISVAKLFIARKSQAYFFYTSTPAFLCCFCFFSLQFGCSRVWVATQWEHSCAATTTTWPEGKGGCVDSERGTESLFLLQY